MVERSQHCAKTSATVSTAQLASQHEGWQNETGKSLVRCPRGKVECTTVACSDCLCRVVAKLFHPSPQRPQLQHTFGKLSPTHLFLAVTNSHMSADSSQTKLINPISLLYFVRRQSLPKSRQQQVHLRWLAKGSIPGEVTVNETSGVRSVATTG